MRREIRIIVETERTIELGGNQNYDNWCDGCGGYASLISIEMASGIASVSAGAIYYWMENAEFHYRITEAGLPRICEKAFLDHLKRMSFLPKPKSGESSY